MEENFNKIVERLYAESKEEAFWISSAFDGYILNIICSKANSELTVIGTEGIISKINIETGTIIQTKKLPVNTIFCAQKLHLSDAIYLGTDNGIILLSSDFSFHFIHQENGWFEHIAISIDDTFLVSTKGSCLHVFDNSNKLIHKNTSFKSTISALLIKENALFVSCYGGIYEFNIPDFVEYTLFPWSTSLLNISVNPSNEFIASGTQENCLHFWPYPYQEQKDFQISNYPAKINCIEWNKNDIHLAINYAEDVHVWDFGHGPPVNKSPIELRCGMGKINHIYFQNSLLIATTKAGFIFFFVPEESSKFISIKSVNESITTLLVDDAEHRIYIGTENGKVYAFDIEI